MSREGTFYEHQAIARDPDRASDRAKRDTELRPELLRVWQENRSVYGAYKLWHAPLGRLRRAESTPLA